MAATKHPAQTTHNGLLLRGTIVAGDWEGDPSVIRGVHYLEPYVIDPDALAYDPEEDDYVSVWDLLSEKSRRDIEAMLLETEASWPSE